MFAGIGFHNSESGTYRLLSERFFNEKICKCYREISPGFMRCFGGFSDWSKEAMDDFAEYYEKMQAVTDTPIYMVPGRGKVHFSDAEIEDYCNQVAEKLSYLINEKKVKHLAYYCFSNELGQVTMGRLTSRLPLFGQYQEQLYRAFQNHGLNIGLLSTDASGDCHRSIGLCKTSTYILKTTADIIMKTVILRMIHLFIMIGMSVAKHILIKQAAKISILF